MDPNQPYSGSSSGQRPSGSNPGFGGFNFDFPRINIQNIAQSFSPPNFPNFMSSRQSPAQTQPPPRRASGSREGSSPKVTPTCETCGTKFSFLKRKKNCVECTMDYCTSCFAKESPSSESDASGASRRGLCRRCRIFNMQPLDKKLLMGLRVKDLRWYLTKKRVSAHLCKEKSELVDLILQHNGYRTTSFDSPSMAPRFSSPPVTDPVPNPRLAEPSSSTDTSSGEDGSTSWVIVDDVDDNDVPMAQNLEAAAATPEASSPAKGSMASVSDFKPFNIDDIETETDVQNLTIRQMKLILTRNFVDYKGCCERDEMQDKVMRLWREHKESRAQDPNDLSDENCCKICMELPIDCVLLECGHVVTCTQCGKRLNECPICRQYVVRAVRIFKS